MTTDKNIAELVRRLKAGEQLTDAERTKLEAHRQTQATTTGQTSLLDVFARTFALWLPCRQHIGDTGSAAAIFERRERYRQHGVKFDIGGDAATRQTGWRTLRRLAADGLLMIGAYPGGGRGVRLTLVGWAIVTGLATVPPLAKTLTMLAKLSELAARSTIAPWVAEVDLAGASDWGDGDGWHESARDVEDCLSLPLAEGWACSLADTVGRVLYRLTDEGRAVLNNPPTLPDLSLPEPTEQSVDMFCDLFLTARNELTDAKPTRPNQLPPCPLPASFIPPRAKRLQRFPAGTTLTEKTTTRPANRRAKEKNDQVIYVQSCSTNQHKFTGSFCHQ